MQASRKPVGLVLMDQSMIAGIGNIYRAEILFKARSGLRQRVRECARMLLSIKQAGSSQACMFLLVYNCMKSARHELLVTCVKACTKWSRAAQRRVCPQQAGVHPEQAANTVERPAFERIWRHSVDLLRRGFQSGSILTVDPEEAQRLGKPWTRRRALCLIHSDTQSSRQRWPRL